jgi:anti-sigma factor ChrR (cupin superfamily)
MTQHPSFDQLCDLADGVLQGAPLVAARAHLESCAECDAQLAALAQLQQEAEALPRSIQPPADLWLDIKRDLKPARAAAARRMWRVQHLLAAGLVIAVASSALTVAVLDRNAARSEKVAAISEPADVPPAAQLPAQLASAEHGYTRSVLVLQRTLDERRNSLAPSTIATVERSLRVADSAIAEAREALARDPSNTALARLFASNYERKIDQLRRATELSPRT